MTTTWRNFMHDPQSSRPFQFFTKVNALCVYWTFQDEYIAGHGPEMARSEDIPFEKERYIFRLSLFTKENPWNSELVLFAADGRPRRAILPFHVSVFVWGRDKEEHASQRIDKTCSLLAKGIVSEMPWIPDYDKEFLNKHIQKDVDSYAIYHSVEFLFVFESSSFKHDISQCSDCHRPNSEECNRDGSESDSCSSESSCDGKKNRKEDRQQNVSDNKEQPIQSECAKFPFKSSNFPSNLESLSLDFGNLLKNETLTDVKLKCRGRDRSVPAHRAVLSARSEVFATMFCSELAESQSSDVEVPDVDDDAIDPFMQYLYTGKIPSGMPDEGVPGLYTAANKYAVHTLREECCDRMISSLTEENCINFLTLADVHSDVDFKKLAIDYICNHEAVLKGDAWREFAKKHSLLAIEVYDSFVKNQSQTHLDVKPK